MTSVTSSQWIFLAIVFVAVFGVGLIAAFLLAPDPTRTRVRELALEGAPMAHGGEGRPHWIERIVHLTGPLARLSVPTEGWERSPLRVRFMNAGLRGPSTPAVYFTAKSVLAIGLPTLVFFGLGLSGARLTPAVTMAMLLIAAAIGYYLPNAILSHMVERRQRTILESFPDALDLLTVCVEAGLGLDAALLRVATEMEATSPVLSEELHLVNLELRAGSSKEKALRNLSLRTGVEDVDTLVAMLIQAERFGTSVADSLRVHSDALRTKRRLRAEEAAAKIPIKLLFPLIFCIFPSMMLVLLGPAFIRIFRMFFPIVQQMQ
jgi:tight adherence protein C